MRRVDSSWRRHRHAAGPKADATTSSMAVECLVWGSAMPLTGSRSIEGLLASTQPMVTAHPSSWDRPSSVRSSGTDPGAEAAHRAATRSGTTSAMAGRSSGAYMRYALDDFSVALRLTQGRSRRARTSRRHWPAVDDRRTGAWILALTGENDEAAGSAADESAGWVRPTTPSPRSCGARRQVSSWPGEERPRRPIASRPKAPPSRTRPICSTPGLPGCRVPWCSASWGAPNRRRRPRQDPGRSTPPRASSTASGAPGR